MSLLRRWTAWVDLLERRESATTLALIRIAFGLIVAGHVARQWMGTEPYYWYNLENGGLRELTDPGTLAWFGGAVPAVVKAFSVGAVLAGLLMVVGFFSRAATFAAWFCFSGLADLNGHAGGSYDELVKIVLFLLLLSGAGRALSFDARGAPPQMVSAWPRWLIAGQLILIYWTTALQKLSDSWVPGGELDALWFILQQPTWASVELDPMSILPFYPVLQLMTLSVWLWEHSAPLLLLALYYRDSRLAGGWLRSVFNRLDFRLYYLGFGVLMHLGIDLLMDVGPFSLGTVSMYLACFHPDELEAVLQRLKELVSRRIWSATAA